MFSDIIEVSLLWACVAFLLGVVTLILGGCVVFRGGGIHVSFRRLRQKPQQENSTSQSNPQETSS